jgi:hypothetical protein
MRRLALIFAAAILAVGVALADLTGTLAPAPNHPAINYFQASANDPIAKLNARLADGSVKLAYEPRGGYLKSVLGLLKVLWSRRWRYSRNPASRPL